MHCLVSGSATHSQVRMNPLCWPLSLVTVKLCRNWPLIDSSLELARPAKHKLQTISLSSPPPPLLSDLRVRLVSSGLSGTKNPGDTRKTTWNFNSVLERPGVMDQGQGLPLPLCLHAYIYFLYIDAYTECRLCHAARMHVGTHKFTNSWFCALWESQHIM